MRRLLPFVLLTVLVPTVSLAASQHRFHDRAFGFALRYPSGWTLQRTVSPTKQITFVQSGHGQRAITVTIFNWHAKHTLAATLHVVKQYNVAYRRVAWKNARLGNAPARVAVLHPQTEGGVGVAEGIYLSQWKGRVYQIQIAVYAAHAPKTVAAFPAVYHRILSTWRFIK